MASNRLSGLGNCAAGIDPRLVRTEPLGGTVRSCFVCESMISSTIVGFCLSRSGLGPGFESSCGSLARKPMIDRATPIRLQL